MRSFVQLLMFVVFCFSSQVALALSNLPEALKDKQNWNREFLEELFLNAKEEIRSSDFEEYKYIQRNNDDPGYYYTSLGSPRVVMQVLTPLENEDDYLYANTCLDYGLHDIKKPNEPWQLAMSRVFRFTNGENRKLKEVETRDGLSNYGGKPFIFSGAFNPEPRRLESISNIFSQKVTPTQVEIYVAKNNLGIFSDIGADVSFNFRKSHGVLVGKVIAKGQPIGYNVCYKKQEIYCYARAKTSYYDSYYHQYQDVIRNAVVVAEDKSKAAEAYESAHRWDCAREQDEAGKAYCEATKKAVKHMSCAANIKSLGLQRVTGNNRNRYWFEPIDSDRTLNFW